MGKYLAILDHSVKQGSCDKSDISDERSLALVCAQPSAEFGRLDRSLDVLEARCPEFVAIERWQRAVKDGRRVLAQWGKQATALGWTARDLFGLHQIPDKPALNYRRLSRYDETGLIWLLQGRPVVALTDSTAAIKNPAGAITAYRKNNKPALGPVGDSLEDLDSCGPR
jgi:hypothetical protein